MSALSEVKSVLTPLLCSVLDVNIHAQYCSHIIPCWFLFNIQTHLHALLFLWSYVSVCAHMHVLYVQYMVLLYIQYLYSHVYVRESNILRLCLQATKSHHFHSNTCRSVRSACSGWTCQVTWLPSCQPGPNPLLAFFVKPSLCWWSWWIGSDSMWPVTQLFNV